MLARFAERSAQVRSRERVLHRGLRGAAQAGYLALALPANSAAAACRSPTSCASNAGSASYAPATALAINMHLYWTGVAADLCARGRSLAAVDSRGDRARRGLRRRTRRERQRHPGAAVDHEGRTRRRRLPVHRPQVVRQPDAGLDLPRHPRHGHERSGRTRRSCTRSCRATPRATGSRRRGTSLGMRATRSDDTILDGVFVPDRYIATGRAGRRRRDRSLRARRCSRGRSLGFGNIYYGLARRALRR